MRLSRNSTTRRLSHTPGAVIASTVLRSLACLVPLGLVSPLIPATESEPAEKPDIEVTVTADIGEALEAIGATTFTQQDIQREGTGGNDLNQLTRTLPNVQFDRDAGIITEDSILNIRPAEISIAGGRTYENAFLIEGLSTDSVTDTTNTSMHIYNGVVGHPQTTFVNPELVGELTVFESDVPAEFGGFTGGAVSARLRNPSGRFGGGLRFSYASDGLTDYLTEPGHRTDPMPEKPRFTRRGFDVFVDSPVFAGTAVLFGYSREQASLQNTGRHASYGVDPVRSDTISENFVLKAVHRINDTAALAFTSIYTPYEQENHEQGLKLQFNNGWLNKLEFTRTTDRTRLETFAGYQLGDNHREQEPNLYTYKNFGADDSVDWVADTASSGAIGGNGDFESEQIDIPIGVKYRLELTDSGALELGAQYTRTQARRARPTTNNAYRHYSSSSVTLDPRVVSAYGADDLTVIEGEQALDYKLEYRAFETRVTLQTVTAWAQWEDKGRIGDMPWAYRAGVRYDRDDFLENSNFGPRLTTVIQPLSWLSLHAGANRYYTNEMLAYKLAEGYPDTYTYRRSGHLEGDSLVFYDDWTLYLHTRPASYGQSGVKTPYSDELSLGATFQLGTFGSLRVHGLQRHTRDEFSSTPSETLTYDRETGGTSTYRYYTVTNDGFTDYRSLALTWQKTWRSHRFMVSSTFSETETTTEDYFSEEDDEELAEQVYYNGTLRTRREMTLERTNYARPAYVTASWGADWLEGRLLTNLLGRWNPRYTEISENGTITVDGSRYDLYEDEVVPAAALFDLNVTWIAWRREEARLALTANITNVFNRIPYSTYADSSDPYQQGRAFRLGASYQF